MSEKSDTNPFSSALKTVENSPQTISEQDVHVPASSTDNSSKDVADKRLQDAEHSTKTHDSLGPSESGSPTGFVRPTESSGLNPFLAVDTSPTTDEVNVDSTHQQIDGSKEVEVHQEFSFGPQLPKVNCKEKIVICFDLSSEVDRVPFIGRDGTPYNSSALLQNVLNVFIQTKNAINPEHEFALAILQEKAIWYQDFTNDCNDVIQNLYDLNSEKPDCEEFDLTSLFEVLYENVRLPTVEGDIESLPPPYIVRTILLYGRSKCIPTFTANREVCEHFLKSPFFFMDVFYIHEAPTDENCCKEVYDVFLDLDELNRAYINEVGRNITQLHDKMAMFLAHPLQRPYQQHCQYTLKETPEEI